MDIKKRLQKFLPITFALTLLVGSLLLAKQNLIYAIVQHGATISKGCESPKQPGENAVCDIQVGYNDAAGDTISIDSAWDVQDFGGDNVRVPVAGNLPISAVAGNTTCTVAGALPCLIGPAGSTLSGLPGTATNGSVTFHAATYVIQADDPNPLEDQGNADVHDLCDSPTTENCSQTSNRLQFTASAIVQTPTPTPTNTPTPTPTNTPTPTPTNTPTPTPTNTPTNTPTATPTNTPTNTPTPTPTPAGCTYTQGYWKNHASAWPTSSLTLGTVVYTKTQLLSILNQPVKGNGLVSLAHQLIAAKLNAYSGATSSYIAQADTMIGALVVPPVGSGFLSTSTTSSLTGSLDTFNQGLAGSPHCSQ